MLTRQERVADLLERAERLAEASIKESGIASIWARCDQVEAHGAAAARAKALLVAATSHLEAAKALQAGA